MTRSTHALPMTFLAVLLGANAFAQEGWSDLPQPHHYEESDTEAMAHELADGETSGESSADSDPMPRRRSQAVSPLGSTRPLPIPPSTTMADTTGPELKWVGPESIEAGSLLQLATTVSDPSGVLSVELVYRTESDGEFTVVELIRGTDHRYHASVGTASSTTMVEYSLRARDYKGNETLQGCNGAPCRVAVTGTVLPPAVGAVRPRLGVVVPIALLIGIPAFFVVSMRDAKRRRVAERRAALRRRRASRRRNTAHGDEARQKASEARKQASAVRQHASAAAGAPRSKPETVAAA